jgi:hypothetical protein
MMNSIFHAKIKEKGRNYLYDDIEATQTGDNAEFTEDDLQVENQGTQQPFHNTPPKKKREETNPYMDVELSATMGKLSKSIGNRKKIDTDKFQMQTEKPSISTKSSSANSKNDKPSTGTKPSIS